jgi:GTP-binding protein LepA
VEKIRNFSIIAHIDHGKSTLADRFLEITGTIEKRKMRDQVLDSMELERERGITIKMQPVRMNWNGYEFNLIDTPGHIDFSYEVSRALTAVEGAVLLVDATQGVQAQTLSVLRSAQELGLAIVPAVSKIDSPNASVEDTVQEVARLLDVSPDSVLRCSGKTGEGVEALLKAIIERVPPPKTASQSSPRALIFDFQYSDHQGVIVYVRVFDGAIKKGDSLQFAASERVFNALEVGTFAPAPTPLTHGLSAGSIGYIVTGIKEPGLARVGDTIRAKGSNTPPLPGYAEPAPVVWASVYPESQDEFTGLRQALSRLKLSDSSLSFAEEASGMLGRGFRCGFLGMLHLEIVTERLKREFKLELVVTTPSITYEVELKTGQRVTVFSPAQFPLFGDIARVWEPFVRARLILPSEYLGAVMPLLHSHEALVEATETFSESRVDVVAVLPLRELMRNFFDMLKSVTQGYGSMSYHIEDLRLADVVRLDLYVAEELVPAFSRVTSRHRVEDEANAAVEKLYDLLPRQMFATKIQAQALGRILSSRTLSAMSKDVTQHMYGGDITRKMKLREKQKKGKKKMLGRGRVNIPGDVFLKMVKSEN